MVLRSIYEAVKGARKTRITYKLTEVSKFAFEIDAVVSLNHTKNGRATNFPVEEGFDINDHVILEPETITLSGIMSDFPLTLFGISNPFAFPKEDSIKQRTYDIFKEIRDKRILVTIETDLEKYENMYIENMSFPRNAQTQNTLVFDVSMKKLIIVSSEATTIPDDRFTESSKDKGVADKPKGKVAKVQPSEEASSIFVKIADKIKD